MANRINVVVSFVVVKYLLFKKIIFQQEVILIQNSPQSLQGVKWQAVGRMATWIYMDVH